MTTASACCGASRFRTKSSKSAVISGGANDRKEEGSVCSGADGGLCSDFVHRGGRRGVVAKRAGRGPATRESICGPERGGRRGKSNFRGSLREVPRRRWNRAEEEAELADRSRAEGYGWRDLLAFEEWKPEARDAVMELDAGTDALASGDIRKEFGDELVWMVGF